MENYMRKLALWHTRTFNPIMSHDELEPIMATLGFAGQAPAIEHGGAWKEYVYAAANSRADDQRPRPRARLPYPRVDGLHIYTYRAFIDAVNFYLRMCDFSDLFHIRGMPLHRAQDKDRKLRLMQEDDSIFVYREGTLDQSVYNLYHFDMNNNNNTNIDCDHKSAGIRDKGNNVPDCRFVPLKDLVPSPARLEKV